MWVSIGDALRKQEQADAPVGEPLVVGPQLPFDIQRQLAKFAAEEGPRLQRFMDFLSVTLLWTILHQGSPGSSLTTCPVHSWPTLGVVMGLLVIRIGIVVLNGTGTILPLPVVLTRDVLLILSGVYLSSTALTSSFEGPQTDVCGTITNSVSGMASLYGDLNGLVALLGTCLTLYTRPFSCGDRRLSGASSVLIWIVLAVAVQVTFLDLWLVPTLASALEQVDPATFASLDAWWSGQA